GDLTAAKPLLEQARSMLDENTPGHRRDRAAALSFLAAIAYARVEPEAVGLLREAADDARKTGDPQRAGLLLAMVAEMLAQLGHVGEAVALIGEAERGVSSPQRVWLRYLARRAVVYLRAGRVAEAMADLEEVLAERSQIPTFELASSMVARGFALGRLGRLDAARDTLTEGLRLVHELQAPTLLPDMNQALAAVETAAGDLPKAARHVREVLEWALPHAAVIDAVGALHLAVVLAARLKSPQTGQLAAAVRGCRLATGLPTWPVTEAEYAGYDPWPVAVQAVPAGPLRPGTLAQACELALSALSGH